MSAPRAPATDVEVCFTMPALEAVILLACVEGMLERAESAPVAELTSSALRLLRDALDHAIVRAGGEVSEELAEYRRLAARVQRARRES